MYATEPGIPIPEARRARRTEEAQTMEAMPIGESFPIEPDRVNAARCAVRGLEPKKFLVRKMAGQGWRVWRTA